MRNFINIVLIGPMGAGKTSMGKALARKIGWTFYDSDQVVEEIAGVDLLWIYDLEGEEGFHRREQKVISDLMQKRNIVLATGGSTVAVPENRDALVEGGLIIYLSTSLDDQLIRTGYSKKRPLSPELEERRGILKRLHEQYVPLYEDLSDISYNTDNKPTRVAVSDLVNLIREKNTSIQI
ncbi:MAG: shikimate kinase AroK [Gammaproteobacteria bacterium]|nr:shikimate kinase AroK [Gammaproteobacteria bacterium]